MTTRAILIVLALLLPGVGAFAPDAPPASCFEVGAAPVADVLFLLDLTGSMGGVLSSAKSEATAIMGDLAAQVPDIRFAAASHMDYPNSYSYPGYSAFYGNAGDYPWRLDQDLTTSTSAVQAAINGMSLGDGGDGPESYVTAMYEATESVSWGNGRTRVVVFFADNVPHDLEWNGRNTGGEPGRDAIAMTADDLDWQTVVANMSDVGIRVVGIDSGGADEMMTYLANETGGSWTQLGSGTAFRQTIVDMVLGVVGGPTPKDDQPPTVSVTSPTSARIIDGGVDLGPSPFPETVLLSGGLDVTLAAADDCKLKRVDVRENGAAIASFTDVPLAFTYPAGAAEGLHTLTIRAIDWVGQTAETQLSFRVLNLREGARAQGVFAATNVPVTLDVDAGVAIAQGPASTSSTVYGARVVGPVAYETLRASAASDVVVAQVSSSAWSRLERVDVLGGLIVADVVRASSSSAFDVTTLTGSGSTTGSAVAGLVIAGTPIDAPAPGQEVAIPGVGFVRLFEVIDASSPLGEAQQINMIHAFIDTPTFKGEIIIGSAQSHAGFIVASTAQARDIDDVDDAGTNADAGATPGQAMPLSPGVVSGRLGGADRDDAYTFLAVEGDRIALALLPSARVGLQPLQEPTAQPTSTGAQAQPTLPEETIIILYDPDGQRRDSTDLTRGDRIEFNADVDGTWMAVVHANTPATRNYTVAFDRLPVVFLSGDDLDGDAPPTCAAARVVNEGLHAGVLRRGDNADAWAFDASLGDVVTAVLKPDELDDGANFDLFMYDPDCVLVSWSNLGAALAKGLPDLTLQLPAQKPGLYTAVVTRVAGSANYYLHLASTDPQPTAAPLQARDSEGPGDAVPLQSPALAQGRFADTTDNEDWFRVTGSGAPRLRIAVEGGAASSLGVEVYVTGGGRVASGTTSLGIPVVSELPDGTYDVRIIRHSGGGNYLIAAASSDR